MAGGTRSHLKGPRRRNIFGDGRDDKSSRNSPAATDRRVEDMEWQKSGDAQGGGGHDEVAGRKTDGRRVQGWMGLCRSEGTLPLLS